MSTDKSSAIGEVRFNLRLPADLHQRIVDRAQSVGRSMNSEIVWLLSAIFEESADWEVVAVREELARVSAELQASRATTSALEMRKQALARSLAAMEAEEGVRREGPEPA